MNGFAVCVPLYEAARPYFPAFASALARAAKPFEAKIFFAVDGVRDGIESFRQPLAGLAVEAVTAPSGATVADVRRLLLQHAAAQKADVVVFSDCDDELEADALAIHAQALEQGDFSYGDQILVDRHGTMLGETLYENWRVPQRATSIAALLDGNFVGFSGCAMRRSALTCEVTAVPSAVLATDWWVFSRLLLVGAIGCRAEKPVVRYRQYVGNIHGGAEFSRDLSEIYRRAEIAAAHFANLPQREEIVRRRTAIELLLGRLSLNSASLGPEIEAACRRPACWYADVVSLALQHANKK